MTEVLVSSEDIEKAVKWCGQARDILKIRHKSKTKIDENAGGFLHLSTYLERVKFGLSELKGKSSDQYAKLAQEFVDAAKLGQRAKENDNQELANLLLDNLILLDLKIQIALGKRHTVTSISNLEKSQNQKEQKQYETALKNAKNIQLGLMAISKEPHVFTGLVPVLIENGELEFKKGGKDAVKLALNLLGGVGKVETEQRQRHKDFVKYGTLRSKAQDYESSLHLFDIKHNTNVASIVSPHIREAEELANVGFQYKKAIEPLEKVEKSYKQALGKLSKEQLKAFEAFKKARKNFEDAYEKARGLINKARSRRDMLEGAPKDELDKAQLTLDAARRTVDNASDPAIIKQAEEHLKSIEGKIEKAKELSVTAKENSKANLAAMTRWFELLKIVEREYQLLTSLRGTESEQKELQELIGSAKSHLKPGDGETMETTALILGYPEAVLVLEKYTELLNRARTKNQELLGSKLPEAVSAAVLKICQALKKFQEYAPQFVVEVQIDEMNVLVEHISTSLFAANDSKKDSKKTPEQAEKEAIEQCVKLETYLDEERERLIKAKADADEWLNKYDTARNRLLKAEMPAGMMASADRLFGVAKNTDLFDREWRRAATNAETAYRLLEEAEKTFNKYWTAWKSTQNRLELFKEAARSVLKWPTLMSQGQQLLDDSNEVQSHFNRAFDFAASTDLVRELFLETQYARLQQDKIQQKVPGKEQVDLLAETLRVATRNVREKAATLFDYWLPEFEKRLLGLGEPRNNRHRTDAEQLLAQWEEYRRAPDTDPPKITETADEYLKNFESIRMVLQEYIDSPEIKLLTLITTLKTEENKRIANQLPKFIREQIEKLQNSQVAGDFLKLLEKLEQQPIDDVTNELESLRDSVIKAVDEERKAANVRFEQTSQIADEMEKALSEIKGRHKNFQVYQSRLEAELLDAKTMIASGDPDLLELARKSLKEITRRVAEVHPNMRSNTALRYSAAEDEHGRLSERLGRTLVRGGTILIENRLPNTYLRLKERLESTWDKASNMSPAEAYIALHELAPQIDTAWNEALRLNDEHERYKERKKQFENDWSKLKKKTHTSMTERTKNVELYIASRLEYAEKQRHTESGLPTAYQTLIELENEVRKLLSVPDKKDMREELQMWDAKCFEGQELVRDMARQFKVELEYFKETLLKQTKERIKANLEKGLILEVDANDSIMIVDGLKKQASAAGKVVKPYLAILDTLKIGADQSPPLDKVKADFKTARELLYKGKLTAERLAEATTTTNVNITEDLKKVQEHWVAQVKQFAAVMREFSKALKDAAAEVDPQLLVPKETEVSKETEVVSVKYADRITDNAKKAEKLVEQVTGHFSLSAFQKPFAVLTEPQKSNKEKLAAREEALRTMREYRDAMLGHPILRKLTDKSNPVSRDKLLAASGYVRAALKRIEVETLIGV